MTLVAQPLAPSHIGVTKQVSFFRYGQPGARPKVYIQAALHAGEMTGTIAVAHLRRLLDEAARENRIVGEVILAPIANPIGLSQFLAGDLQGRFDGPSLTNYNRDHFEISGAVASALHGRLTQDSDENVALIRRAAMAHLETLPETNEWHSLRKHLLLQSIDADVCLDLHSDMDAVMFMYINAFDWPALQDLSCDLGCRAVLGLAPYVPSATFAGVVGALWPRLAEKFPGVPIPNACQSAMIEMRGKHDCSHELAEKDARAFLNFLQRRGVLAGEAPPVPESLCDCVDVEAMDVGYAPKPGFVTFYRRPGDVVAPGDVVCEVIDPTAADGNKMSTPVVSRQNGAIYARALDGTVVVPGRVLFRIAGAEKLAHRKGRSWLDD